jgi:ribosomal protein L20
MAAFRKANIALNRKQLAELAIHDQGTFDRLVAQATAN